MLDIEGILKETGAFVKGHFLTASGFHTDTYIQFEKTLQYTWYTREFGAELALKLHRFAPDCIVSPSPEGIVIGYEVARNLDIPFIFAEYDEDGKMAFKRSFNPLMFKNIVIIKDVIVKGKTIRDVMTALKEFGTEAVAVSAIASIEDTGKIEGLPAITLINIPLKRYRPEDCPMCKEGLELSRS